MSRWAWAEIDHDAIRHNVEVLRRSVAPSAVWAVVKADGYGHGAIDVADRRSPPGPRGCASPSSTKESSCAGRGSTRRFCCSSEQPLADVARIVEHRPDADGLHTSLHRGLGRARRRRARRPRRASQDRHRDGPRRGRPGGRAELPRRSSCGTDRGSGWPAWRPIWRAPTTSPTRRPPISSQRSRPCSRRCRRPRWSTRRTRPGAWPIHGAVLVRSSGDRDLRDLARSRRRPSLPRSAPGVEPAGEGVVPKRVEAGTRVSYGLRHTFVTPTTVATIPIGYADGVPRRLFETGGEVLVGGRRRPIVGVVTMDQLMVDVGDDPVAVGDEVVLIGGAGRRTCQRRGMGRPAGHDRLRDRVWREQAHRTCTAP